MANSPGMKVLAVKRHRLLGNFVYFRTLRGVQPSPLELAPNRAFECGPLQGRHRDGLCVSGLRSSELSAQVRRGNVSSLCIHVYIIDDICREYTIHLNVK